MTHRVSKLTISNVKQSLATHGMTITRDTVGSGSTGSGEYRVTFKVAPWLNMTSSKAEKCAYYTDDLEDAFNTGVKMAQDMTKKVGVPKVRL